MQNKNLTYRIVRKLFPDTTFEIELHAYNKGMRIGDRQAMTEVRKRLEQHHVKHFEKPGLTLGYTQAVKAAMGELD